MSPADQQPDPGHPARDRQFERDFLGCAARDAKLGSLGFEDAVQARLDRAAADFGDSFLRYSLERFVKEIGEEGEDVAGWSVGAAQCLDLTTYDDERRELIMHWLIHLAGLGARIEWAKRQLAALLD